MDFEYEDGSSGSGHLDDTYSYTASDEDSQGEAQLEALVARDPILLREVRDAVQRLILPDMKRVEDTELPGRVPSTNPDPGVRCKNTVREDASTTNNPAHSRPRRLSRKEAVSDLKQPNRLQVRASERPQPSRQASAESGGSARPVTSLVFAALLAVLAGYGMMAAIQDVEHALFWRRDFGGCGSSVEEAQTNGCVLDLISLHWVRPECHYKHIQADYRSRTNITYYRDSSLDPVEAISIETIRDGSLRSAWINSQHKRVQCSYMTDVISSALMDRLPVDSETANRDRIKHCSQVLMDDWSRETQHCQDSRCASQVVMRFTVCSYVQDHK